METPETTAGETVWTVQKILQWTAGFLKSRGVESARLEAELLLAHARQCPRIRLYTDFDVPVSDEERARMREMVRRRAQREPLAYIIGEREFYGRSFHVGRGVLVPRPETETLIDLVLEVIPPDRVARIADVGCGSGCIGITLALQRPQCQVIATDTSPAAVTFTQQNAVRHGVTDRVRILQGDLLQPVAQSGITALDAVVSNPPYIRDGDMAELAPEVAEYEPGDALLGGPDGMDCIRRLVTAAADMIRAGGLIALEIDPPQADTVCRLLDSAGFEKLVVRRDLNGQDRIVSGFRLAH